MQGNKHFFRSKMKIT